MKALIYYGDRLKIVMDYIKYLCCLLCIYGYAQDNSTQLSVYFDTDSHDLSMQAQVKIDSVLNSYQNKEITNIFLTGYCDDRGTIIYNKELASQRIWSIIDYLRPKYNYGIFSEYAFGEVELIGKKNISDERATNRRVDIEISYESELVKESLTEENLISEDSLTTLKSYDILKDSLSIGDKLVFNNIIFYPGRHKMRPVSYPVMDSIINSLLLHKKYEIEIQGHICCLQPGVNGRDMDTGEWNLSQARASAVKRLLIQYGVNPDRLTAVGKRSDFKTGKGDYYDRRVEILITGIREED